MADSRTLLLVDAYAMIFRAYYAFIRAPRMNSRGENTSAIFGFVVTLEDLLKRVKPTHLGVAFDPHGPTFRHEAYEAYKAQRDATPEEIHRAVPIIQRILRAMNIPVYQVDGFEADDVIGTLAKQAEQAGFMVYMATPDKDYGQLVTDRVHIYRPRHTGGFEDMGPREVCDKFGLTHQSQVIDLLGLMGDASDNIPGCKGVGEKTAVKLLQDFGSIDQLLERSAELKGALRTKVETQAEDIRFSRFLATIRTDVPVTLDENALLVAERNTDELVKVYEELEFESLLRNMRPSAAPKPKPTKPAPAGELTLSLFGDEGEPAPEVEEATPEFDTPENRLVSYLLNPELSFNPRKAPDMEALRANPALYNLYEHVELPLMPVLRRMEQAGVRVDVAMLHEAEQQLTAELRQIEQQVADLLPEGYGAFNIASPKQVGELLFDALHLDDKAKRLKSGQYSTSEEVLLPLRDRHPIVGLILDYRELSKLISTYVSALPGFIDPADGKIHTTYHQTVTATGRLSSSNPNLQNLPIRSERGKLIRRAVVADPGCVFVSADYSQIELRLLAHLSQDPNLLEAFRSGQDIHAATAARIFGCSVDEVTRQQRSRAKTANFGILYGISAFGLSQQLDCSRQEAKQLIDDYFAAFPQVVNYIESQKQLARDRGYAETLFGRRRYLPDITSRNATVRSFAERNAVNAPIQGTAADIIKMAMVAIDRRLQQENLQARMIMQVHDELNFCVPEAEAEQVRRIVVDEMENATTRYIAPVALSVPLIAECGLGPNWLTAH